MRVIVHPEARVELRQATDWYAQRSHSVARRFLEAYKRAKALIVDDPNRWPDIGGGVRRVLFDGFPYALLYAVDGKEVVVLVVKHHKRHPDYWKRRLR